MGQPFAVRPLPVIRVRCGSFPGYLVLETCICLLGVKEHHFDAYYAPYTTLQFEAIRSKSLSEKGLPLRSLKYRDVSDFYRGTHFQYSHECFLGFTSFTTMIFSPWFYLPCVYCGTYPFFVWKTPYGFSAALYENQQPQSRLV